MKDARLFSLFCELWQDVRFVEFYWVLAGLLAVLGLAWLLTLRLRRRTTPGAATSAPGRGLAAFGAGGLKRVAFPLRRQLADRYLFWQVVLPLVGVWCYLLDGMFIGATRAAEMRNSMAVAAVGFALTLLTLPWLGNHGLWLALTVFLALRGLSLAFIWRRHWRNGTWFA